MQTFTARTHQLGELPVFPPSRGFRTGGFRAPGRIVLLLKEGKGWVADQDGIRQDIAATTVVAWEQGDWVEYGLEHAEGKAVYEVFSETRVEVPEEELRTRFPAPSDPRR